MKITPYHPLSSGKIQRPRRASESGSSFADFLSEDVAGAPEAGNAAPLAATSGIGSMLALQEVSDEEGRRRKSYRQAHLTLDTLEELRNALLLGEVPRHLLDRIAQRIREQRQQVSDPRLQGLLKDIELRAAVELAKLEQAAR